MKRLSGIRFDSTKGVHDHIMKMRAIIAQLKSLKVKIFYSLVVYLILNSLSTEYGPFKIFCTTRKEKWSINKFLTICVQEEERLKQEKQDIEYESASLTSHSKERKKKGAPKKKDAAVPIKCHDNKDACFFCKKKRHMKKDYIKYKKWLKKKDTFISLVCHQSFSINIPNNTEWIDFSTIIHIANII